MLKLAFVAGALLLAPMPVVAQECPGQTLTDVANIVEKDGGAILGIVEVDGVGFDRLIIARVGKLIVVGKLNGECAVGGPAAIGTAAEARDA